jgi:hypothetical protein
MLAHRLKMWTADPFVGGESWAKNFGSVLMGDFRAGVVVRRADGRWVGKPIPDGRGEVQFFLPSDFATAEGAAEEIMAYHQREQRRRVRARRPSLALWSEVA